MPEASKQRDAMSFEPRRDQFPQLGEKLDHVCAVLGISQGELAQRLDVRSSAISQWKLKGIPRPRVGQLCRCVGITTAQLELADLGAFRRALEDLDQSHPGMRWRRHVEDVARTGLELELLESSARAPDRLKAIYRQPVAIPRGANGIGPLSFNDRIGFRLPAASARLSEQETLGRLLLIVDDSENVQLVTRRAIPVAECIDGLHIRLPSRSEPPFFVGPPEGRQSAFLLLLANAPDRDTWNRIAAAGGGAAADLLLAWMKRQHVGHKVSRADYVVVRGSR